MKNTLFIILLSIGFHAIAQSPEGVNYQMVVRNFSNVLITNSPMAIRVQIRQTSATGTIVYSERHPVTTSAQGLVNLVIGGGTVLSGTFSTIQWANGPYFACFSIDFTGLAGTNYQDYGSQQLMSVPYALYAKSAGATLNQWQYGTAVPAGTLGVTGNYYYDTSNGNIYYKQNGTTWILTGNIMGPTGPQGITGAQGPQGIQGPTGATGPIGPQGLAGINGVNGSTGPQGSSGINTLISSTYVSAGVPCATGGIKLEYGLDNNNNGLLDFTEINSSLTKYVCNGAIGATGATGPQGPVGLTGSSGAQGPQGIQGLTGATGLTGPQGPSGTNGTNGMNGTNGTAVLNGTTAPSSAVGANGDFYINTVTNMLYGPKANGLWPTGTSLVGPTGATGPMGPQGLTGATGAQGPQGIQGLTGTTGLTGPQGPSGTNGTNGMNGTNGAAVLNGTIAPSLALGANGDFYINTATNMLYGPKTNGTWPTGTSLVGPTGATGPTGPQGLTGATGPQGQIGLTGATGAQGPQGIQGLTGATGSTGAQGPAGTNGTNGSNGLNALIKTTTEPAGMNCSNGGTKIETGLDANSNGVLEVGEVNVPQTKYVCNGVNGTSGSGSLSNLHGSQVFTSSGFFICPKTGSFNLILWGATGGNGGSSSMAYGYFTGGVGGLGAFIELTYDAVIGDTIYFSIGNQGSNGDDCFHVGSGFYCCGQRPNGSNGNNTVVSVNSDLSNNYIIIAQGGFGGGGSGISCGANGYYGSPGSNGSIEYCANFNSTGFFILNQGISQCKYGICPGNGKLLIRW